MGTSADPVELFEQLDEQVGEFVQSRQNNAWIYNPLANVYLRKGRRIIQEVPMPTLEIGNIEINGGAVYDCLPLIVDMIQVMTLCLYFENAGPYDDILAFQQSNYGPWWQDHNDLPNISYYRIGSGPPTVRSEPPEMPEDITLEWLEADAAHLQQLLNELGSS